MGWYFDPDRARQIDGPLLVFEEGPKPHVQDAGQLGEHHQADVELRDGRFPHGRAAGYRRKLTQDRRENESIIVSDAVCCSVG